MYTDDHTWHRYLQIRIINRKTTYVEMVINIHIHSSPHSLKGPQRSVSLNEGRRFDFQTEQVM